MGLIKCPDCSRGVSDMAVQCPNCGYPIAKNITSMLPETVTCLGCKQEFGFRDEVCPHCGLFNSHKYKILQPAEAYEPQSSPIVGNSKSRSAAVLLAMLLGGLGLHKFYLNKPGAGALYLFFCWTFVPAILGFLEGISYLSMTDAAFKQRYAVRAK